MQNARCFAAVLFLGADRGLPAGGEAVHTAALILAGGKSSRFGRDKSLLTLHGERIVDRLVAQCRTVCDEVIILCGGAKKFHIEGVQELQDLVPGQGPMGGIYTGMSSSSAELFLVLACDMPRFDAGLAQRMLQACAGFDACVPRDGERLEPLCAVYRRTALPQIREMLDRGEYQMRKLFPRIRTRYWAEPWPASGTDVFYNINYPSDYAFLTKEQKTPGQ